eukprot:6212483-Pleurochrysis_carterae.AAC.6
MRVATRTKCSVTASFGVLTRLKRRSSDAFSNFNAKVNLLNGAKNIIDLPRCEYVGPEVKTEKHRSEGLSLAAGLDESTQRSRVGLGGGEANASKDAPCQPRSCFPGICEGRRDSECSRQDQQYKYNRKKQRMHCKSICPACQTFEFVDLMTRSPSQGWTNTPISSTVSGGPSWKPKPPPRPPLPPPLPKPPLPPLPEGGGGQQCANVQAAATAKCGHTTR